MDKRALGLPLQYKLKLLDQEEIPRPSHSLLVGI